jgi:hypothetical protein
MILRAFARRVLPVSLAVFAASPLASALADGIPRPEHPNPQMQREAWLNLNGPWQFWEGDDCDEAAALARSEFPDVIVVPYCRESRLSGLGRTGFVKNVVYRRELAIPREWRIGASDAAPASAESEHGDDGPFGDPLRAAGGRVLLHVGACDWRTVVWMNGRRVALHEGGSAPITCDVTDALREGGATNELRVWAFDDGRSRLQQCGKQSDKPESYGCVYTRTTGIWQTVWIERVGRSSFERLDVDADPGDIARHEAAETRLLELATAAAEDGAAAAGADEDSSAEEEELARLAAASVRLVPRIRGRSRGTQIAVEMAQPGGTTVQLLPVGTRSNQSVAIGLPFYRLWSPADPFLYATRVALVDAESGETLDVVSTYFGLRRVTADGPRVLLNDAPVFQRLILDQGFWPDGIWTAPSDDELRRDIERSQAAGFNGARLHQKVFEPRFHYWADKLGYLTWGEAPSWGNEDANPATHRVVLQEWLEIVQRDRNHPSIVGWCPFNETGAGSGPLQDAVTAATRALDPSRLLLDTSGYVHSDPARDVDDAHDYDQDPETFKARWWPVAAVDLPARYGARGGPTGERPFFVSEFGGIGWRKQGEPGWGYGNDPKTEEEWFVRFQGLCDAQLDNPALFGFCYTQLTDVEQERNGLYLYDRAPKFDLARIRAIVARKAVIEKPVAAWASRTAASVAWRVVVPAAVDDRELPWSFVAGDEKLADESWRSWKLADAKDGRPGFGAKDGFAVVVGTPWKSKELYLRRRFEFDGAPFSKALLVAHHDEDATVCLNGEVLFARKGWNDRYEPFDVTEKARALLKKGSNELTVHVSQTGGGQYFDAALLVAPR